MLGLRPNPPGFLLGKPQDGYGFLPSFVRKYKLRRRTFVAQSLRTKHKPPMNMYANTVLLIFAYNFPDNLSNKALAYMCAGSGLDLRTKRSFDASLPVFTPSEVLLLPIHWG